MDEMREEFEAVYNKEFHNLPFDSADEETLFKSGCWWAWQASRQALVVELPPQHEVAYRGYDSVELRYALKNAGIKWTE